MNEARNASPVDDHPQVTLPRAILERLVSSHATPGEYQIMLLVALLSNGVDGNPVPVSEKGFSDHPLVIEAGRVDGTPVANESWPWDSIELCIARGLILRMSAENESGKKSWLFLNTVSNASFVGKMVSGEQSIPRHYWIDNSPARVFADSPTIFRLYEQNIGPLTPMIAQRLIKSLEIYPAEWVEGAFEEAVSYNRRNWRYISRILENWAADGPGRRTESR